MTGEFCSLDSTGKRVRDRTLGEMEQVGPRLSSFFGEVMLGLLHTKQLILKGGSGVGFVP